MDDGYIYIIGRKYQEMQLPRRILIEVIKTLEKLNYIKKAQGGVKTQTIFFKCQNMGANKTKSFLGWQSRSAMLSGISTSSS